SPSFPFYPAPTLAFYTLSLHDALPIWLRQCLHQQPVSECLELYSCPGASSSRRQVANQSFVAQVCVIPSPRSRLGSPAPRCLRSDRKSTRLNSSHVKISYAVFCLKKKK